MGIKIITDKPVKVWRRDLDNGHAAYSISVGKKEGDSWINGYQPIRFKKGVEVYNGQEISIKDAFPTLDSWVKDGKQFTRIVWQIMEFEKFGSGNHAAEPETMFSAVDEDVPF